MTRRKIALICMKTGGIPSYAFLKGYLGCQATRFVVKRGSLSLPSSAPFIGILGPSVPTYLPSRHRRCNRRRHFNPVFETRMYCHGTTTDLLQCAGIAGIMTAGHQGDDGSIQAACPIGRTGDVFQEEVRIYPCRQQENISPIRCRESCSAVIEPPALLMLWTFRVPSIFPLLEGGNLTTIRHLGAALVFILPVVLKEPSRLNDAFWPLNDRVANVQVAYRRSRFIC
ncbi:uncharacterized protein EV420DRAFT_1146679 [Desarmillaria tabescens]|uniref:Uncharacterized protein n=1 Tax=Armillaria tabescens TaxID=1929756 RepID=A0AA39T3Z7_ARMTA|nr:uncharacterized protein EV420DRAFT_1146679 [Desarmillaria tabescens]KAK0462956.1 hypothetical protein EV420DRAFT_1146679 [Desarmillaria tabescens]